METVLKYDRIILVKEMNERIKKVGEIYEIANVLDDAFVLRDSNTRTAVGVVSFEDFEKCFTKEEEFKGWTPWCPLTGFDGQTDAVYRTNRKKVQVKFLTNKVRAEASCNKNEDEFNLFFGVQMAYLRALNKANEKKMSAFENELKEIYAKMMAIEVDIKENKNIMKRMTDSLM